MFDFFGPSIDTGFRVVNKCNARYLTLSVEVAYALVLMHVTPYGKGKYEYPGLKLMGSMELKGVWGGRDYPVFAIDLEHSDPVNTAMAKFLPETVEPDDIKALCRACYDSDGWPFRMYLSKSSLGLFDETPRGSASGISEAGTRSKLRR
ncbi:hypothetical protein [Mycobacteroides abscessus]|uniref:hypothetical protein n=1 Tax=Mycobacteroides abscessus TaxID=36809 RepID=UPI000E69FDDC|nr:hypothetical protein [Mycobacteroides abscessus]RIT60372.1 hypothetical protein D2E90_18250 [Mycobacteroides abscessus]